MAAHTQQLCEEWMNALNMAASLTQARYLGCRGGLKGRSEGKWLGCGVYAGMDMFCTRVYINMSVLLLLVNCGVVLVGCLMMTADLRV